MDYDFLKWVIKESDKKIQIITGLLHINNSSKENKKCHNITFKEDFDKLMTEGSIKNAGLIKGCVKGQDFPEDIKKIIEKEKFNDIEKRIIMGILLTDEPPYKVVMLTVKDKIKDYEDSEVFKKVKDLTVKSEEEGVRLIASLFRKYKIEKDFDRA